MGGECGDGVSTDGKGQDPLGGMSQNAASIRADAHFLLPQIQLPDQLSGHIW